MWRPADRNLESALARGRSPKDHFLALVVVLIMGFLLFRGSSCSLRTYPPIRYIPILGKENEISTTAVLSRALRDRDITVRAQAVRVLGMLSQTDKQSTKEAAARELGKALQDRDAGIRLQAVEVIGTIEQKYSNKYLLRALKDPNPFIRARVLEELSGREDELLQTRLRAAQTVAEEAAAVAEGAAP